MDKPIEKTIPEIDDETVLFNGVTPKRGGGRPKVKWPLIRFGDPIPYEMYLAYRTQLFVDKWADWKVGTRCTQRDSIIRWEKYLNRRNIDRILVVDYLRKLYLTIKPSTVNKELTAVGGVFHSMITAQTIQNNPFRNLPKKKVKKGDKETATEAQFNRWIATAKKSRNDAAPEVMLSLHLMWHAGLSMSDAFSIKWRNVDMTTLTITGNRVKTGTKYIVPFVAGGALDLILQKAVSDRPDNDSSSPNDLSKGDDNFLMPYFGWCVDNDEQNNASSCIRAVCDEAIATHSLRRAFCSRMVATGFNTMSICRMTGHTSPAELNEYVTLDQRDLREIVEAEHNKAFHSANEISFQPTKTA